MGLVYLPTFTIKINHSCRLIYHIYIYTWILWDAYSIYIGASGVDFHLREVWSDHEASAVLLRRRDVGCFFSTVSTVSRCGWIEPFSVQKLGYWGSCKGVDILVTTQLTENIYYIILYYITLYYTNAIISRHPPLLGTYISQPWHFSRWFSFSQGGIC